MTASELPGEEPPTVLLVDDRPDNLLALQAVLEPLDLNLICADSGAEALRCLLGQEVAAIILDVQMPDMDGFETAQLLKSRAATRHIPIIFLTAISDDVDHQLRGYEAGAVDYISKPFDPKLLRAKVRALVEMSSVLRSTPLPAVVPSAALHARPLPVAAGVAVGGEPRAPFGGLSRVVDQELVATEAAPGIARATARAALAGRPDELIEAVTLLVSELVTNAVCHARSAAWLSIDVGEALVRVDVADHGPGLPTLRPQASSVRDGRGLQILRGFAHRCGYTLLEVGKSVWFEIDLEPTGAT